MVEGLRLGVPEFSPQRAILHTSLPQIVGLWLDAWGKSPFRPSWMTTLPMQMEREALQNAKTNTSFAALEEKRGNPATNKQMINRRGVRPSSFKYSELQRHVLLYRHGR